MKGALVTLYLRGGHAVTGSIVEFSETSILIKTLDGSRTVIPSKNDVVAIKYILKENKEVAKEHKVEEDIEPTHKPGDIESLTQLRKMKHEETLKNIRSNILKPTPTAEEVTYGSVLQSMHAFKNDTKE